jgi:hypothetical protein
MYAAVRVASFILSDCIDRACIFAAALTSLHSSACIDEPSYSAFTLFECIAGPAVPYLLATAFQLFSSPYSRNITPSSASDAALTS